MFSISNNVELIKKIKIFYVDLFQDTFQSWRYVIWINVISQMIAFIVFTLFGSAKIQSWNYPDGVIPTQRVTEKQKDEGDDVTSKML